MFLALGSICATAWMIESDEALCLILSVRTHEERSIGFKAYRDAVARSSRVTLARCRDIVKGHIIKAKGLTKASNCIRKA